jgi:WD40 repeat protein
VPRRSSRLLLVALLLLVGGALVAGREAYRRRRTLTLEGHEGSIAALAYAPEGDVLASGDVLGVVRLWRDFSGECALTLPPPEKDDDAWVTGLAFSPSGDRLAIARGFTSVELRSVPDGRLIRKLVPADEVASSVMEAVFLRFSPSGNRLAVSRDARRASVRVWSTESGQLLACLRRHWGGTFVAEDLVAAIDSHVGPALFSAETGAFVKTIPRPGGENLCETIVSPRGESVLLWEDPDAPGRKGVLLALPSLEARTLTFPAATWPEAISSDGKVIALHDSSLGSGEALVVLPLDLSRALARVPLGDVLEPHLAFSPSHDRFAFAQGKRLQVVPFSR